MAKNPYLDTLPTSLAFLGAKRWPEMFFSLFQTIFFLILELKEASGGSENFQNGLCMAKNPYFDPSWVSVAFMRAKRRPARFLGYPQKAEFWETAISAPEAIEVHMRGQIKVF